MKALVISTQKNTFTDEKSGKLVAYSKTILASIGTPKENFSGLELKTVVGGIKDYEVIKNYAGKEVNVEFDFKKVDDRNYRLKIKKLNDIEFE